MPSLPLSAIFSASVAGLTAVIKVIFSPIIANAKKREATCALLDQEAFSKVSPMFTQLGFLEAHLPKIDAAYREIFKKSLLFKEQSNRYFQDNYNAYDGSKGFGGGNWRMDDLNKNRREFRKIAKSYTDAAEDFIQNKLFKTYSSISALWFTDSKIKKLEEAAQTISKQYDLSNFDVGD